MKLTQIILASVLIASCNSTSQVENKSKSQDNTELKASIDRGKIVYSDMCVTCHMANGKGVPRAFPPLADSDFLREKQTESIKAVKNGLSGEIIVNGITYNSAMTPLGLDDDEVADVMNYINNSWENKIKGFVTPDKVSKI